MNGREKNQAMNVWMSSALSACLLTPLGCAATPPAEEASDAKMGGMTETETGARSNESPQDDTLASPIELAEAPVDPVEQEPEGPYLEVPLLSRSGSRMTGSVMLEEGVRSTRIVLQVEDAEPGLHGVHIHQEADCSALDATSAGGHYNPLKDPHGIPGKTDEHHLGDLGNLEVSEDGTGQLEKTVPLADLSKGSEGSGFSFRGRALIVHADPDTGGQPTGNSGLRVGCAELTEESAVDASDSVELTVPSQD